VVDGVEVVLGTDPTVADATQVPAIPLVWLLAGSLLATGFVALTTRSRRSD